MTDSIKNTAEDYEHMMDYVAEENANKGSLAQFIGIVEEYKPQVKVKQKDPDFPEDWQRIIINLGCFEDYAEFMEKIGNKPGPKIKTLIYERPGTSKNIFSFIGDDE